MKARIKGQDLRFWKLFGVFRKHLQQASAGHPSRLDLPHPSRHLDSTEYLSLWLLAMVNPVIDSMRGLCQASHLEKVQEQLQTHRVSLGSFSEAQQVLNLSLLPEVYQSLREALPVQGNQDNPSWPENIQLVDSSLWEAVGRMNWAQWRHQHKTQRAVRVHVSFNLLEDRPENMTITPGRVCERAVLKEKVKPGEFYVGDRNYGRDHRLLNLMQVKGCPFIFRILHQLEPVLEEELPLSAQDRAAGVVADAWVRLGTRPRDGTVCMRRMEVLAEAGEKIVLLTNQGPEILSAASVAAIYKARWRIELFFKWIKSILGNRHFLAHSPAGVAIQMYMALIAALLLQHFTRKRPGKRQMEMIQFYLMGWASLEELTPRLGLIPNPV
ncbi:MAG: IS4 family transposase [Blastochloris sp.]|nr:IS4 family transposase [Blastochloris sp.]